jgi:hypothetical protein
MGTGMGYQKDDGDCALCGAKRNTFNTTQGTLRLWLFDGLLSDFNQNILIRSGATLLCPPLGQCALNVSP